MTNAIEAVDTLISGAHVLTLDKSGTQFPQGAVALRQGRIVGVGPSAPMNTRFQARRNIDGSGMVLLPGLINTHTHIPMSLFRGIANDLKLMDWLQNYIFPAEGKYVNETFVRLGAQLACLEMQLGGITTFCDMYMFEDGIAEEVERAGMRAILGQGVSDFAQADFKTWDEMMRGVEKFVGRWKGHDRLLPAIAPHAPYTVSAEHLVEAFRFAEKHDTPFVTHVAEDAAETELILKKVGKTPVRYLNDLGVLSERTIAAHMIHLDAEEIQLTAQKGVGVAHNPESNMKLAAGAAKIPEMLMAGVRVGLGTDGAASNNDLDLFSEMDMAAKLHKLTHRDPTVLPAKTVLELGTRRGAEALHMEGLIGSIEPGKQGDLVLLDMRKPHLSPMYDATSHVVYAARASDVHTVLVNGKVIVENGKSTVLDQEDILLKTAQMAQKIAQSLDLTKV